MKKYLYILLSLAFFVCLANAAAVTKPKTADTEDSSEDEPKPSLGASTNATRSPKEGLGNGGDSRSGLPGGSGGAGSASNGAGGSSSTAAGGKTIVRSGIGSTKSDSIRGDAATEQKPQVPKNSSGQVPPKNLGGGTSKNHSPKAATGKAPGEASGNESGEEDSANRSSKHGTGANKEGSRRDLHDRGTGRRNSSSTAITVNGSTSANCPGARNCGSAPDQKPQEPQKILLKEASRPTPGGERTAGGPPGGTAEEDSERPGNGTAGRAGAAAGSGGGTTPVSSGRNSNGGANRGRISNPSPSTPSTSATSQVPRNRRPVAGAAGASAGRVGKPRRRPLSGGLGIGSGSSGYGGSNRKPGRGYASGGSSSGDSGLEHIFPEGLGAAVSGGTSNDVLTGPRRGVFPAGLGEDGLGQIRSGSSGRGTSRSTGSPFRSTNSGSAGSLSANLPSRARSRFQDGFPAGLEQESAIESPGVGLGGPGGGTSGSAGSRFGNSFSGPSIRGAGRGAGRSSVGAGIVGGGQFPEGLGGGSAAFLGSSSPPNDVLSGGSPAGQGFPEGLGGGRFGGNARGAVGSAGQSTPVSGNSGFGGPGFGRESSGLSRSRGKPGAPLTAATVLGSLAGVAAAGAIGAGIAAVVQGQGRESKPGKRGPSRSCRRRCKGRKLCLAFCRRERRSISESNVPAEILDQIPRNFERLY